MNEPPRMPALLCTRCSAANPPYATQCWLCSTSDRGQSSTTAQLVPLTDFAKDPAKSRSQSRTQQICAGLLVASLVLTLLIAIGFAVQDRGMLIPLLIVVGPAYLATGLRALHDFSTDRQLKASSLLFTFMFSGLFGVLALALFVIASCVAFFVWCLTLLK